MLTLCSDLFLTDAFLIKGNVEHKYTRLSKLLDEHRKIYLAIRDGLAEEAEQAMRQHLAGSRDRLFEGRMLDLKM